MTQCKARNIDRRSQHAWSSCGPGADLTRLWAKGPANLWTYYILWRYACDPSHNFEDINVRQYLRMERLQNKVKQNKAKQRLTKPPNDLHESTRNFIIDQHSELCFAPQFVALPADVCSKLRSCKDLDISFLEWNNVSALPHTSGTGQCWRGGGSNLV